MNKLIHELALLLSTESFPYREESNSLFVKLPNEFGELEISELDETDDIIGLVGEEWHTHSSCLESEELSPAHKIIKFIKDIFNGSYLLIREQEPEKKSRRTIEESIESYKKYLPEGTVYEVYNKT